MTPSRQFSFKMRPIQRLTTILLSLPLAIAPFFNSAIAQQQPTNNYPLRLERGLVADSRIWVRVNGWLLNVEEWDGGGDNITAVGLAGFYRYCKKNVTVDGQPRVMLVNLNYSTETGEPFLWVYLENGSLDFDRAAFLDSVRLPADWQKPLHELVPPPPSRSNFPLPLKTENGREVVLVNGQEIPVKDKIVTPDGKTLYFLSLFYALAEREYTVDNGQNKRRVFYNLTDGVPYEVITKYNGQLLRTTPLTSSKNLVDLIPFTYFPPGSGYSLTENARGYRQGNPLLDPNSLLENRPQCPF